MSARYYSRRRAGGLLAAALFVAVFLGITLVLNAAGDAPALAAPASAPVAAESVSVPLAAGDGAADLRALLPGGGGGRHPDPHPAPRRPVLQSAPGLTIVKESGWRDGRGLGSWGLRARRPSWSGRRRWGWSWGWTETAIGSGP